MDRGHFEAESQPSNVLELVFHVLSVCLFSQYTLHHPCKSSNPPNEDSV